MLRRTSIICVGTVLAACTGSEPFRVAVVGTGGSQLGAVLAVEDINAAGGIGGRLLELSVIEEPDEARAQNAIALAESLSADARVIAVIGHGGSATSLAASQVYNARHVPQIAPNSSSPLYTGAGPYSFRLVASDKHQADFIVECIAAMAPAPRVAVLYVNDDYGRELHSFLRPQLDAANARVVYDAPFLDDASFAKELDPLVRSLTLAKPDLLVWVGLADELRLLRPRLRAALPTLRVLGSDGVSLIGAGRDAVMFAGDRFVSYTDVTADRPALRKVADRFAPLARRSLTDGGALSYDAVGILADALRSGARDRDAVREFLERAGREGRVFQGITGSIALDENGDARPSYVLLEVHAGGAKRVTR